MSAHTFVSRIASQPLCRRAGNTLGLALLASLLPWAAPAQAFPDKPISLVVPYPPGGATDIVARIIAKHLPAQIPGSTVIVENKAGAGTVLGATAVANAPADGHTLLISSNTTFTMNPALRPRLSYDPIKSFESIGIVGTSPLVVIANPASPFKSIKDVIALARAEPGKYSYGSFGTGTSSHFAGEMFKREAGINLVHVPYKGSAPAMQDLIGGQIPLTVDTNVAAVPQAQAGKVRALAVASAKRLATLPEVPTLAESGLPGYDLVAWVVIVAPKGLNDTARKALVKGLADAMATPTMQADLTKVGLQVLYEPPAAYDARVNKELPLMRALVHKAGITQD